MSVPTSLLLPTKMFPPAPGEVPFVSSSPQRTGVVLTWNVEEENLSMNFHDFKMLKANADVWNGMCFSNYRALRSTLRGSFFFLPLGILTSSCRSTGIFIYQVAAHGSSSAKVWVTDTPSERFSLCTYTARGGKYEMPSVQKPGCEFS